MIAAAMLFNSGILLVADAEVDRTDSHTIFPKQYGLRSGCASSVFVVSESGNRRVAVLHRCEDALASIPPEDCTIDRMRQTVEQSLIDTADDEVDFVAFYSPKDQQYALFRTTGTTLQEVVGYDCEGPAASLGHCLMHDRYTAARSMDSLDLDTVLSIAVDTLDGIRATEASCGERTEMVAMYADGHLSDVRHLADDTRKKHDTASTAQGLT